MQNLFSNMILSCKSVIQPFNAIGVIQNKFQNEWEIGKHKDIHEFFIDFFLKYIARGVYEALQLREADNLGDAEHIKKIKRKLSNFSFNQDIME